MWSTGGRGKHCIGAAGRTRRWVSLLKAFIEPELFQVCQFRVSSTTISVFHYLQHAARTDIASPEVQPNAPISLSSRRTHRLVPGQCRCRHVSICPHATIQSLIILSNGKYTHQRHRSGHNSRERKFALRYRTQCRRKSRYTQLRSGHRRTALGCQ